MPLTYSQKFEKHKSNNKYLYYQAENIINYELGITNYEKRDQKI